MGIVWIASYPKSGNTWVRFLLAAYFSGPIQSSEQVSAAIPDLLQGGDPRPALARGQTAYMKTHLPWSAAHPYAADTDRAVVVVRHPKDVCLSCLNYQRLVQGAGPETPDEAYIRGFIQRGGDAQWLTEGYGTLEQNTASWLDNPGAPQHLLVRYESLKADPGAELPRILEFVGIAPDPARAAAAVSQSSFDAMRALEVRERMGKSTGRTFVFPRTALRAGKTPRYFMNQGRARGSLAHISPDLDRAFDERFGPLMRRLGYPPGPA